MSGTDAGFFKLPDIRLNVFCSDIMATKYKGSLLAYMLIARSLSNS